MQPPWTNSHVIAWQKLILKKYIFDSTVILKGQTTSKQLFRKS